jgi:hypothetical protein
MLKTRHNHNSNDRCEGMQLASRAQQLAIRREPLGGHPAKAVVGRDRIEPTTNVAQGPNSQSA